MAEVLAKSSSIDSWVEKLNRSERAYQRRQRKLMREILIAESLPILDRAVLGLTGSTERLKEFQELAQRIGGLAGRPVVSIIEDSEGQQSGERVVQKAVAGMLTGDIDVWFRYRGIGEPETPENIVGARIAAEVYPVVGYLRTRAGFGRGKVQAMTYVNDETSSYDRATGCGYIDVHCFSPNYRVSPVDGEYPLGEYTPYKVLYDRAEIYGSSLFNQGIGVLLQRLEEVNAATSPATARQA